MNRARNFPPSQTFATLTITLATQHADLETAEGGDEITYPLCDIWSATEQTLIHKPAMSVGDLLLKVDVLSKVAEGSIVQKEEWRALARDVAQINGPGMAFVPDAWLRRWTEKGGGYVRTDAGLSFVTTEPITFQQRLLLDELDRAQGRQNVAALIDGNSEPVATWEQARAAFDEKSAEVDQVEATDALLDEYWEMWDAAMLCPSDTIEAAKWKLAQYAHWVAVCGEFTDEAAEKYTAAIFADVASHALKGGEA
jgi:hypothetical protein